MSDQNNPFSAKDIARFYSSFEQLGEDECWPWIREVNEKGRARIWAAGRKMCASHVSLVLAGKPRQATAAALHTCDNPRCVNASHLRWGTQSENIEDRVSKGRNGAATGARHGGSKLSEADVLAIKRDDRGCIALGEAYGVSKSTISAIKTGRIWKNV